MNEGHGYRVVSTCVPEDNGESIATVIGDEVCKTGPPNPFSTTLKNVLIIGDSVSIGYTPVCTQSCIMLFLVPTVRMKGHITF